MCNQCSDIDSTFRAWGFNQAFNLSEHFCCTSFCIIDWSEQVVSSMCSCGMLLCQAAAEAELTRVCCYGCFWCQLMSSKSPVVQFSGCFKQCFQTGFIFTTVLKCIQFSVKFQHVTNTVCILECFNGAKGTKQSLCYKRWDRSSCHSFFDKGMERKSSIWNIFTRNIEYSTCQA